MEAALKDRPTPSRSLESRPALAVVHPVSGAPAPKRPPATVSVILPTLNEAENVGWVLARLPDWVDEVILVDGHSTDGTVETASAGWPDLVVVEEHRHGKGAALQAGIENALGEVVVMLDADGSMDPAEIEACVEAVLAGFDYVKGSRFLIGGGSDDLTWLRRIGNKFLMAIMNSLYGTRFTDLCYGFCVFRRSALAAVQIAGSGFEIETEFAVKVVKAGMSVAEVPSFETERRSGKSNLRPFRDGFRILKMLLKERIGWKRPPFIRMRGGPTPVDQVAGAFYVAPERRHFERRRHDRRGALTTGYSRAERRFGDRREADRRRNETSPA
jgi:glycosyltransferase involved in cell wall biosynthesis